MTDYEMANYQIKMKKQFIYLSILLLLLASTACKDFLEEEQYTDVSYDYLKTKTGMESAVVGVYQAMRWYCGSYEQTSSNSTVEGNTEAYYVLTEYGTDFTWEGSDGGHKDAFNKYMSSLNPEQDLINQFWNNNYKGITRANTALMFMPEVTDMTDEEKDQRTAELKFMRAFFLL